MSIAQRSIPHPPRGVEAATITLGCAALVARTVSYESIVVTALVGATGLLAPSMDRERTRWLRRIVVTVAGIVLFYAGREAGPAVGVKLTHLGVASIVVAAIAEEAFFRRFVYSWLERHGAAAAIVGSSLLFAAIHVPTYGAGVLPIDLAAGAVLGWQRWATGTWTAPAITHVIANLLQMG